MKQQRSFRALTVLILGTVAFLLPSPERSLSQSRSAGKLVVPIGYEPYDSIRFDLFGLEGGRKVYTNVHSGYAIWDSYVYPASNAFMDAYADSVQAMFDGDMGQFVAGSAIGGKRKGIYCPMDSLHPGFTRLNTENKARTFYPSPSGAENFYFAKGHYWRYNDLNFNPLASWHNNNYDANDISPFCEYPKNDSFVRMKFVTAKYGGTDTVYYGNEGRVLLGYSDDRAADALLRVNPNTTFPRIDSAGGVHIDTAKTFSVNLDFNIDVDSIDTTLSSGRADSLLPLLTLQVLFKDGQSVYHPLGGQSILPFVPFSDASRPSNPGWYKVAEVTVNKHIYDSLDYSWKCEDTLQNGSVSHSWRFKQLHVLLTAIPTAMRTLMQADSNDAEFGSWGEGSGLKPFPAYQTPDSAIADTASHKANPLLELRVLSTYRATVRIRGLDYHDTIADKYLYRKRIVDGLHPLGDSNHSCNPNGSIGGYDDSVEARLKVATPYDGVTREFMMNDVPPNSGSVGALSVPMTAYLDFMGAKHNLHAHWREQDDGLNTTQYRRFRMIFNGQPPSIFENQYTYFGGYLTSFGCLVFPQDYIYYSPLDAPSISWPSSNDTLVGIITARRATADPDSAYHVYQREVSGFSDYAGKLRGSNRAALWHPNNKRSTTEAELQGWAITHIQPLTLDTINHRVLHYDRRYGYNWNGNLQRPTTPEETIAQGFVMLAEGIPTLNSAQGIDCGISPYWGGGSPGVYGVAPRNASMRDTLLLTHSYNLGHEYSWRDSSFPYEWSTPDTSDMDADLPPFYLGYSNNWRAYNRLLSRINQIYDSTNGRKCPHPYRYLTWLDAYSNSRTTNDNFGYSDSSSKTRAFLKIQKTQSVLRWTRGPRGEYLDSAGALDPQSNSFVEVGMFKDSISATTINRAAIVVNTHLYPSLRDAEDLDYYNQGLDTLSMCHPVYGDIDVRKIYMTIDTNQFESAFRSAYYVVRDLWHPDTTWLVKCDSQFAVYIKPGDAKFLYFEKAVSIIAAVGSQVRDSGFCFNNGHRVAERMSSSRDVITYTRNHHVYVSYPARGYTFTKNEQSGGDNIATGIEIPIDTTHFCAHPSIMVARNDTGVALVYWMIDSGGKHGPTYWLRAAYQPHPDTAWTVATELTTQLVDISPTNEYVTPVLAPIGDTTWMIVAANNPIGVVGNALLQGFKYYTPKGKPSYFDFKDTILIMLPVSGAKVQFPTVASRPLPDTKYPLRLAYQYRNQIYYTRFRFDGGYFARHDSIFNVSAGLNDCENLHPCIATNGTRYRFPDGEGGFGSYGNIWIDDDVVWETKFQVLSPEYLPPRWMTVIRHRYQTDLISGQWGGFDIWVKDRTPSPLHWPEITAQHEQYTVVSPYILWSDKKPLHDWIRATWQADSLGMIWIAGWIPGTWYTATFQDLGRFPSLGLTTDSIPNWSKDSVVPLSIAFQSYASQSGSSDVRVTNGWVPWIATAHIDPTLWLFVPGDTNCLTILNEYRLGHGIIGTPTRPFEWLASDQGKGGQFDDDWPPTPRAPYELHTNIFAIHSGETITLNRTMDSLELTNLRSHLTSGSDYVQLVITLRRWADSSYLGTLDSFYISTTVNRTPGAGLPSSSSTLTLGSVGDDSAFLSVELKRGDSTNSLQRTLVEEVSDSINSAGAAKATAQRAESASTVTLSVHPNPFNPRTWIELGAPQSLHVRLELYDMLGRRLQTLYDGDSPQSGNLHLVLDASALASGSYLLRATSGNEVVTRRIVLSK